MPSAANTRRSFYGLLAAEQAGIPMDPTLTGRTEYPRLAHRRPSRTVRVFWRRASSFSGPGEMTLAERFLTHLAESQNEPEVGQLADCRPRRSSEPHIALMIAKRAADGGIVVPRGLLPGRRPRRHEPDRAA